MNIPEEIHELKIRIAMQDCCLLLISFVNIAQRFRLYELYKAVLTLTNCIQEHIQCVLNLLN